MWGAVHMLANHMTLSTLVYAITWQRRWQARFVLCRKYPASRTLYSWSTKPMFVHPCWNASLILAAKWAILTPNSNYTVASLSRLTYFQPERFLLLFIVDYKMIDPHSSRHTYVNASTKYMQVRREELQNFTTH
jgi:hypothetical protein